MRRRVADQFRAAAIDPLAVAARRSLVAALPPALVRLGLTMRTVGHVWGPGRTTGSSPFGNGEDGLVALGYITETAAELISAAADVLASDRRYAAAAITRQLVEIEYLTWAFAFDQAEAADWLRSTNRERRNRWQPRHLRERSNGRFDSADYQQHCELGGHPTPMGARALVGTPAESQDVLTEVLWSELCHHGSNIWTNAVLGGKAFAPEVVSGGIADALDDALRQRDEVDRLPRDLKVIST